MKTTYILFLLAVFVFTSCAKKEEKKKAEDTVEQVKDSVPKKEIKKEKVEPELVFTVQIGAFKNKNNRLSSKNGVKVSQHNSLYKYRLQTFASYDQAKNYRKSILDAYPDAFIQALKNGKPINIKEALK